MPPPRCLEASPSNPWPCSRHHSAPLAPWHLQTPHSTPRHPMAPHGLSGFPGTTAPQDSPKHHWTHRHPRHHVTPRYPQAPYGTPHGTPVTQTDEYWGCASTRNGNYPPSCGSTWDFPKLGKLQPPKLWWHWGWAQPLGLPHSRDGLNHVNAHLHTAVSVVPTRLRQPRHAVVAVPQDLDAQAVVLLGGTNRLEGLQDPRKVPQPLYSPQPACQSGRRAR